MGLYENFIFTRTYARWIPEACRRETWEETVSRFCDFIFSETLNCDKIPSKTKYKIRKFILNQDVMPSMRLLWSAGENCRRDNIAAYNCSALAVCCLEAFGEMMYLLLAGTGAGYSVETKYVDLLPVVNKQRNLPLLRFVVPDTRLGWKQSIDFAIKELYSGRDVQFDLSQIRPAGTPLKTSGGYASGPEPLQRCLEFIRETMISAQGRQLTTLEASDIMNEIASSVVCGGVRRSSQICLCDIDDELMMNSKQGEFHPRRFMANISAVYRKQPKVLDFTQEFINSAKSGSGERGIFNLVAAKKRSPKRRNKELVTLTNPCFAYDTKILTKDGYESIGDLDQQEVTLINKDGNLSRGKVWSSGEKEVVKIKFRVSAEDYGVGDIRCTPNHVFMLNDGTSCEAKDLKNKRLMPFLVVKDKFDSEGLLAGFIQGDGCTSRLNSDTHKGMEVRFGAKDLDIAVMFGQGEGSWYSREAYNIAEKFQLCGSTLPTRVLPPFEKITADFIAGLYSANGSIIKGHRIAIKSTCLEMLVGLEECLLNMFGIDSYITTNKSKPVEFANGTYICKESYDLNIARYRSIKIFAERISFGQSYKREALRNLLIERSPSVSSVKPDGVETVYDFSEPITNWGVVEGVIAHNCAETLLRDMGLCNLTEVIIRATDDFDTIQDKIKTATWLGCIQATLTSFPNLRPEWQKNAEEERLLGVSLTGLCDNIELITPETLRHWKRTAIKTAKLAAGILDINVPAAITVGKPSGCRPWNGLITTDEGIFTLQDLFVDHDCESDWSPFKKEIKAISREESFDILQTFNNGEAHTVDVNLSLGMKLQCTPNHQWFVKEKVTGINRNHKPINQWVAASDLEKGDILDISPGIYSKTTHVKFEKINSLSLQMREDAENIKQPDTMNADIAWFLGYLWGDGAMSPSKYRIRFIDNRVANLEKAQRVLKDQFNINTKLHQASQHRKAMTLDIGSKTLWHWLIKNDIWKYYNDNIDIIPTKVRSSSYTDIIAFVAGMLDADGWMGFKNNDKSIMLTTASELLARHIQEVALAVGLVFGVSKNVGGNNLQKQKKMFLMGLAQGTLPEAFEILEEHSNKAQELNDRAPDTVWRCLKSGHNTRILGKVQSVTDGEVINTYDIETSSHWFYAGAVKSHNTVSQLVNASSGIHSRWSPFYIRRVRISTHDALFKMMVAQGMPYEMDLGNHDTAVFSFPIKSPEGCKTREEDTAIGQLDWYRMLVENWCEMNMSCTIFVKEEEWLDVCAYVYKHFDTINGVSFFPYDNKKYNQPPYEDISEEVYLKMVKSLPNIDFSKLSEYEFKDTSEGARTLACTGNSCEL